MPSIEISLSSDSHCAGGANGTIDGGRRTVALYQEHAINDGDLAVHASNLSSTHGYCIEHNGHHYHDIIQVNDEMEDDEVPKEKEEDSSIFLSRTGKHSMDNGVVGHFASMIQYNFASRATMGDTTDIRRRLPVHFVEHRM
ncbi:expressed unknown protein [Seminavis robusta]|uniref:Uncharacterized protein n=1 Tax=Seminavis robusta TaxID=568900 RepID=A0A9N8HL10_9STRA|nr:expressed unknown protein [Seminavis robusta]|eukprot:Sro989_g228520.1 n/a (141) ;mRNA; f:31947-32369